MLKRADGSSSHLQRSFHSCSSATIGTLEQGGTTRRLLLHQSRSQQNRRSRAWGRFSLAEVRVKRVAWVQAAAEQQPGSSWRLSEQLRRLSSYDRADSKWRYDAVFSEFLTLAFGFSHYTRRTTILLYYTSQNSGKLVKRSESTICRHPRGLAHSRGTTAVSSRGFPNDWATGRGESVLSIT